MEFLKFFKSVTKDLLKALLSTIIGIMLFFTRIVIGSALIYLGFWFAYTMYCPGFMYGWVALIVFLWLFIETWIKKLKK